jgi:hypothetical protein
MTIKNELYANALARECFIPIDSIMYCGLESIIVANIIRIGGLNKSTVNPAAEPFMNLGFFTLSSVISY